MPDHFVLMVMLLGAVAIAIVLLIVLLLRKPDAALANLRERLQILFGTQATTAPTSGVTSTSNRCMPGERPFMEGRGVLDGVWCGVGSGV